MVEASASSERMDSMELASRLGRAEGEARAKGSALAAAEAEGQALRQQLQVRRGGAGRGGGGGTLPSQTAFRSVMAAALHV